MNGTSMGNCFTYRNITKHYILHVLYIASVMCNFSLENFQQIHKNSQSNLVTDDSARKARVIILS